MLELTFFSADNEPNVIAVSEYCYKRLAEIGFSNQVEYKYYPLIVEDEKYEIFAVELIKDNRDILLNLIEVERQSKLELIFDKIDEKPTIKEFRAEFKYIKELTLVYSQINENANLYFSYD